jgi:hypothetical protein
VRRIAEETARRWLDGARGPFGRDAPPPPVPTWGDDDA